MVNPIPKDTTNHDSKDNKTVLFDDFNGTNEILDTAVWRLCGYESNAWGQRFKNVKGYENVKVEDGVLRIKASKDQDGYKNGGMHTKIGFKNNTRLEVRAKLDKLVKGGFPVI